MEVLYWALEYAKVAIIYLFMLYVWPSVVFKKHLSGRSRTYRFAFCTVVMVTLVNSVVLGLGLVHLLNKWIIRLFFFGIFFYSLLKGKRFSELTKKRMKHLVLGTYGFRTMLSDFRGFLRKKTAQYKKSFLAFMKGHWFDYSVLAVLVIFGVIYFSAAVFEDRSYGFGDLYVHHAWIYGLTTGEIFSGGIYPEGMHCFLACENMLFGIDIQSLLLFTAGIHSSIILISMVVMLRQMFTWKYSPYIILALFLTVDVKEKFAVTCLSRWQWTMPQEFGFPAMFLCVAYLIKYLREKVSVNINTVASAASENGAAQKVSISGTAAEPERVSEAGMAVETESVPAAGVTAGAKGGSSLLLRVRGILAAVRSRLSRFVPKCFKNEHLFIFIFCLATTINCHFYTMIFAFFLCFFTVIFMLGKVFIGRGFWKKVLPLAAAIIFGVMISIIPMVGAFAEGIEFQNSIGWAMSIMGFDTTEAASETQESAGETVVSVGTGIIYTTEDERLAAELGSANTVPAASTVAEEAPRPSISERIKEKLSILYEQGYVDLYEEPRATVFILAACFAFLAWAILRFVLFLRRRRGGKTIDTSRFVGYPAMALISVAFTAMFCAENLGIPYIIEWYRVCVFAQLGALSLFVIPVDIIALLLPEDTVQRFGRPVTLAGVLSIYVLTRVTGIFHGYMMFELTRYNSAVIVTKSILDDMKGNNNFTIISTTDEYYQQMGHGFHEEIINFVNAAEEKGYTLPSEYLFIYVEKQPIRRAQHHIFEGPSWIAEEKYLELYDEGSAGPEHEASQCPNIYKSIIQEPLSTVFFDKFPLSSNVYNTEWLRTIIMSKLYVWCQKFNQMYPNELHTYYEDDNFVCYYLVQNPRNLYELAVFDPELMIPPNEYPNPIWPEGYYDEAEEEADE